MERLNQHIFLELSRAFHMGLVGPRGAHSTLKRTRQVWECPAVIPLPKFLFCVSIKGIQSALQLRARIILAGSGLTAPIAYIAGKIVGARVLVYLHGLDVEVRHPIYRWLWRPFFRRFDLVIVNSKFTKRLAENAGVSPQRIVIIHP
ncbi:MAG: glycosyltransferase, partial [Deltaproteobacteria bacterium]|nr:glycosyltransferase [Deltaproteobacteria bacterium]